MNKDHNQVWHDCLEVIKDNVSPQGFKTWFEPIKPVKLEDSVLTIQVPSQFFYEWLEEHYVTLLKKIIKKEIGAEGRLEYSIIMENNLKIDYSFYITNQIMKPVQQVFALVLEKIWTMQKKLPKIKQFKKDIDLLKKEMEDNDKFEEKKETLRCKEIKVLLFDDYLRVTNNEKNGVQSLTKFFDKK
jgi:chromosomal replication initiation ATPase DnaA